MPQSVPVFGSGSLAARSLLSRGLGRKRLASDVSRVSAALLVFLLAYIAWQIFGWGGPDNQVLIGDLAIIPPTLLAAICCWSASRRNTEVPRLMWGWRLMALGIGGYVLGEVAQLIYEMANASYVFPSLADPLYLAFYPLILAAVVCFSQGFDGTRSLRTALDAATLALGGAAVIWYLLLGPTATTDTGGLASTVISLAYPVGDLVLIVALARVLTEPGFVSRRPLELLALGLVVFVVADVIYGRLVLEGSYVGGDPVDTLWILAMGAFAISALLSGGRGDEAGQLEDGAGGVAAAGAVGGSGVAGRRGAEVGFRIKRDAAVIVLAPYVGTAAVFVLLVISNRDAEFFPQLSLVLVATAMAGFVTLRQILVQRDLVQAHQKLREAHRDLETLAGTDPLTGLANQRTLVAEIEGELARFQRHGRGGALLFLDIDHFKSLNDTLGHAAGDDVLREFGAVVVGALRSVDVFGRWGGEEFLALLPEVGEREAIAIAERVRERVSAEVPVTVSIGLALFPEDGETRSDLLAAADEALYRAKREGRDAVRRGCGAVPVGN